MRWNTTLYAFFNYKFNQNNWCWIFFFFFYYRKKCLVFIYTAVKEFYMWLSVFQTDVVGHCEVDYKVAGVARKSLLLKKTRNIPSCTTRSSTTSFIKGVEYDFVGVSKKHNGRSSWPYVHVDCCWSTKIRRSSAQKYADMGGFDLEIITPIKGEWQ